MINSGTFRKRSLLFIVILGFFLGGAAWIVFKSQVSHRDYSSRISVSIRQKALADEISKLLYGLHIRSGNPEMEDSIRDRLKVTQDKWENAQKGLVNGSELYGSSLRNSPEVQQYLQAVSAPFVSIRDTVMAIVHENRSVSQATLEAADRQFEVYLSGMNDVTGRYMAEGESAFSTMKYSAILLAVLAVVTMVLLFRYLLRPALMHLESGSEELEVMREHVDQANQVKTEFLANMSHEIRTPLNGVIGMSEILAKTTLNEEQRGYVRNIHTSALNLLDVVNDILDFSQMQAGKLDLDRDRFVLSDCIDQVVDLMKPLANEKKLELMSDIDPAIPLELVQDERRLRQVLLNLVNNAVKFTERGEIVVRAEMIDRQSDFVQIKFSVRDTGIGMNSDQTNRLFNAFTQLDSSSRKKYGGSGLGLAICKDLIQMLGGRIWVESEAGKGSTFYFTVVAETSGEAQNQKMRALQGLKALVVDDNKTNLKILVKQLSAWGIQATPFNSPDLVTEVVSDMLKFDFCILDMQMPEMDGRALAEKIRERYSSRELPIIVLSSLGQHLVDKQGNLYNAFLTKPVRQAKLLDTITEVLNLESRADAAAQVQHGNFEANIHDSHLKVLIAHDNEINRAVTSRTLSLLGHSYDSVNTGAEVIEQTRREDYDLIILDVDMPSMNGIDTVKKLKKIAGRQDLPVIIGITDNEDRDRKNCIQAGMDDLVGRPMNADELQRKIHYWFDEVN